MARERRNQKESIRRHIPTISVCHLASSFSQSVSGPAGLLQQHKGDDNSVTDCTRQTVVGATLISLLESGIANAESRSFAIRVDSSSLKAKQQQQLPFKVKRDHTRLPFRALRLPTPLKALATPTTLDHNPASRVLIMLPSCSSWRLILTISRVRFSAATTN